jgi:hypothetical protein
VEGTAVLRLLLLLLLLVVVVAQETSVLNLPTRDCCVLRTGAAGVLLPAAVLHVQRFQCLVSPRAAASHS